MSSNQMMPQYNNPGPSSSRYGYPYLQDLPFHSEQQTYTPLAMKAYSSFAARGNAWHFQSEDETSDKESPYKQLNQSPTTSLPKKSGHRVRFSFQTTEKTNQISNSSRSTLTGTDSFKPPKVRKKFIYILIELGFWWFSNKNFIKVSALAILIYKMAAEHIFMAFCTDNFLKLWLMSHKKTESF
jgi:hypothetical protein